MAGTWEIVRHRAAIAGRVKDSRTGEPLADTRIEIIEGPPAFTGRVARAARDGFFHFLDLPVGQYTLKASRPGSGSRYGISTAQVTLSADGQGNVPLGTVDLALSATAVQGRIKTGANTVVWMAEVRVQGSGERTWSDAQGIYVIPGIEAGARRLTISARGFQMKSEAVTLGKAGEVVIRDVTLSPS